MPKKLAKQLVKIYSLMSKIISNSHNQITETGNLSRLIFFFKKRNAKCARLLYVYILRENWKWITFFNAKFRSGSSSIFFFFSLHGFPFRRLI